MAKWEIIEDNKFKKQAGGKTAATRAVTTKNSKNNPKMLPEVTVVEPKAVTKNKPIIQKPNLPPYYVPAQDASKVNQPYYENKVIENQTPEYIPLKQNNNNNNTTKIIIPDLKERDFKKNYPTSKINFNNNLNLINPDSLYYGVPYKNGEIADKGLWNKNKILAEEESRKSEHELAKSTIDIGQTAANLMELYPPTIPFGIALNKTLTIPSVALNLYDKDYSGVGWDAVGLIPGNILPPIVDLGKTAGELSYNVNNVHDDYLKNLKNIGKQKDTYKQYEKYKEIPINQKPLIKQYFKNGGKVSGWQIVDDIPKFKRGGKTNLNSTVEEELKNTVQVNQNGQVTEYDPSSPEYKKLYESGRLTSYDPKTDAYITPPLKEFIVVGEKPEWAKEKEKNQSKYNKDWYIDNYLPKFSRNMGISANNMNPNDVERYNRIINDKTVEDIFKRYPLFDSDYANNRLETLKQLSPKEVELIKNSSYANKIEPSIWQDFEQGLLSFNSGPVQFKNENLTQEEAKEKSNPLGLLAPLAIPYNMTLGNAYTQQQGEKNYSWEKALKGQKPIYNSTAASIAGDPLNLLGLGLFKGLVSAGKIAKLEDAYQLVKGLGKEEALNKLKSLISLDNIGKNSFTPVLDNVGAETFGTGKPPVFKSKIDWGNWNKEIPSNIPLLQEYNTIEQTSKANGTWMKNPDGSAFQGTPEQFIQQNSQNFKKAFPEGSENVFRGTGENISELRPNRSTFTANQELASGYAPFNKKSNFLNSESTEGGVHNFYRKNSKNSIELDGNNTSWTSVDLSNKRLTKDYFERNIKSQEDQIFKTKEYLSKMKQEPNGSWKAPDGTTYSNDLYKNTVAERELYLKDLKERYKNIDNLVSNPKELEEMRKVLGDKTTTDDIAAYVEKRNLDYVKLKNIEDSGVGDVTIVNHKPGNYLKSAIGNNGMFDMTNPNIYKSILPYIGYTGAGALTYKGLQGLGAKPILQQQKNGGIIEDPMGQWAHPGSVTKIPSNQITMQGVNYPVLGISDRGHTQMMYPGEDYSFRGKSVTEYPMMQDGGEVNFTYAGENHRVYEKVSPTGNGKGIEGHIMVNHPTENKKRWDTIDLTKITNGRVKTVAQGVASTKKWHKENPEYADGGKVVSEVWEETTGLPWSEAKKLGLTKGGYEENLKLRSELLKNPDKFISIAKNNIPAETRTPTTNTNVTASAPIEPIQNTLKPVEPVLNNINVPKPIINNTNPVEPVTIEPEPNLLSEVKVVGYLEPSKIKQQRDIIQATRPRHNYAITDKVANKIYYYDPSGKIIKSEPVITGKSNNDVDKGLSMADWFKQTGSSNHEDYFKYLEKNKYQTTPSGIYSISGIKDDTASDPSKLGKFINFFRPKRAKEIYDARIRDYGEKQKMFTITNEQGKGSSKAIHGTANPVREKAFAENSPTGENRNLSNGCINVNGETICFETLEKKSKIYILPEENTNLLYPKSKNKLFQKQNNENLEPYKMASAYKMGLNYKMGGIIKRADSSYSQRGLWDNIRDNANGGQVSSWEIIEDLPKAQAGILTPKDSLYHQRDKTIKYDLLRGGAQGNPLPQYSNTAYYNQFYKDSVEPKLKYYPTAMEKGDAGDFIFNIGKDPRVFAYQEYLRKTDPTNKTGWQDASGNWKDRKTLPSNFDSTYDNTIGKFSENERRVAINNGRDWYYKNTYKDPKDPNTGEYTGVAGVDYWSKAPDGKGGFTYNKGSDGTMSPAYAKTWYGRIWNNNDFKEFDPNNPKFTPPAQKPGQSVALPPQFKKGGQVFNWQIIEDSDELDEYKNGGKTSAWQRKEGKSPSGGLNAKGRASLKKEGHDIKPPQPEGGSRKDSFCARMSGMKKKLTGSKKANDPNSRINLSLKKWKC
jgi:hypothetical protein